MTDDWQYMKMAWLLVNTHALGIVATDFVRINRAPNDEIQYQYSTDGVNFSTFYTSLKSASGLIFRYPDVSLSTVGASQLTTATQYPRFDLFHVLSHFCKNASQIQKKNKLAK